ncbi:hypothetical protein D3C77_451170 [compost metagenome]
MSHVSAKRVGEVTFVAGPGFEFKKVGDLSSFKQAGRIPSIRAAKTFCKLFAA